MMIKDLNCDSHQKNDYMPPIWNLFPPAYWFDTYFVVLSAACLSLGITSVDRVPVETAIVRPKM